MKTWQKLFLRVASCLLIASGQLTVQAALLGPVYPAPGGNNWSGTGSSAGDAGGVTWAYSGFNSSAFSHLYWGPDSGFPPNSGLDNNFNNMTFSGISGNKAVWTGTTSYFSGNSTVSVGTELDITLLSGGQSWVLATSVSGLASSVGAVLDDSSGGNFTVNLQFLAGGQALNTVYHEFNSSSSFTGAFYYTPVPEPATVVSGGLLLLSFGAGILRVWRPRLTA